MNAPHELATMLDALERALPGMVERPPDEAEFWRIFTGAADAIKDNAGPDDAEYMRGRIDCMPKNAGMIPGEDAGEPCR